MNDRRQALTTSAERFANGADTSAFAPTGPQIERLDDGSYRLTASTVVKQPRSTAFDFFADAANLDAITPPWLKFRILTLMPVEMGESTLIDYSLKLHALPVKWQSQIEDWRPGHEFTDVQVHGPYRSWRHTHRFESLDDHTTLVQDEVTYRVPGGRLIHGLFVRRDLVRIFRYRQQRLAELLGVAE